MAENLMTYKVSNVDYATVNNSAKAFSLFTGNPTDTSIASKISVTGDVDKEEDCEMAVVKKGLRLIQWYIVDANEHVADDKAILAMGTAVIRDEREFLINLGIPQKLEEYNKYRVTVEYDQIMEDRLITRKLKEAKIRDLEIILVTIKDF